MKKAKKLDNIAENKTISFTNLNEIDLKLNSSDYKDAILIGKMSLEDAQQEETEYENQRIKQLQKDMELKLDIEQQKLINDKIIKDKLINTKKKYELELKKYDLSIKEKNMISIKTEQASFRKGEELMRYKFLKDGNLNITYGDIDDNHINDIYGRIKSRSYTISYKKRHIVLHIRINCLRAIKTKLPAGYYAIMVTCYDRLAGYPLYWSKLHHNDNYNNTLKYRIS